MTVEVLSTLDVGVAVVGLLWRMMSRLQQDLKKDMRDLEPCLDKRIDNLRQDLLAPSRTPS